MRTRLIFVPIQCLIKLTQTARLIWESLGCLCNFQVRGKTGNKLFTKSISVRMQVSQSIVGRLASFGFDIFRESARTAQVNVNGGQRRNQDGGDEWGSGGKKIKIVSNITIVTLNKALNGKV